ncbi:MAG: hypothetical protein ACLSX2_04810 [Christensenellaceae bacterium]
MYEKPRGAFETLTQRMADACLATMPGFGPAPEAPADEAAQRQLYGFIRQVYERIYRNPELLGLKLRPDDCYTHAWWNEGRQQTAVWMRAVLGKLDDAFRMIRDIALEGELTPEGIRLPAGQFTLTRRKQALLEGLGLVGRPAPEGTLFAAPDFPDMLPAMAYLAQESARRDGKSPLTFSRCILNGRARPMTAVFRQISGEPAAFDRLVGFLEAEGYQRQCFRDDRVTLDYTKNYGKKDEPLKDNWAEREHGGISLEYRYSLQTPFYLGLRIPRFKALLAAAGSMDEPTRSYVCATAKKCDGCGYCVQTDQTGRRPKAVIPVEHGGKRYPICPMMCGFQFFCHSLDQERVGHIIGLLRFADRTLGGQANNGSGPVKAAPR